MSLQKVTAIEEECNKYSMNPEISSLWNTKQRTRCPSNKHACSTYWYCLTMKIFKK